MQIETETGMIDYKTVTTFFNEKAYSLSENLNYQEDYKAFVVTAIDKLNREAKATLELGVTGIKEGPSIVFRLLMMSWLAGICRKRISR